MRDCVTGSVTHLMGTSGWVLCT